MPASAASGVTTEESSASKTSGTVDFRSGLQSLLVALGSGLESAGETEAVAAKGNTSAGDAASRTAGKSSVTAAGASLRSRQGTEDGSGQTSLGSKAFPPGAGTEVSAAQLAGATSTPASTAAEEKKQATDPESASASSSRPALSSKSGKLKTTVAAAMPGQLPASMATPLQAAPVADASASAVKDADEQAQSAPTKLSAGLVIDPSSSSLAEFAASRSSHSASAGRVGELAAVDGRSDADGVETPGKPGQAASALSLTNSSASTLSAAKAPAAGEGILPAAMRTEGGNTVGISAASPVSTQTSTLNLNRTQASVPDQNPAQLPATSHTPGQGTGPVQVLGQVQGQTQLEGQSANQFAVSASAAGWSSSPTVSSAAAPSSVPVSDSPSIQNKSGAGAEKKTSSTLRSERGSANSNSAFLAGALTGGQSPSSSLTASSMAHTPAGGTVSTAGGSAAGSTGATTGPDSRETFAALDAVDGTAKPTWIHAGAQRAEAGFQDPSLGWVSVRADSAGGGIHAELVPGSTDAAQVLGGHMAGLNAYLADHHTPVETLTLSSPQGGSQAAAAGSGGGQSSGQNAGQGMQQGSGQQQGQGSSQGAYAVAQSNPSPERATYSTAASQLAPWTSRLDSGAAPGSTGSGTRISLIA